MPTNGDDKDRHFDVTVRLRVKVRADAGAAAVDPSGLFTRVHSIKFIDGAGDDRSVVADQDDVLDVKTLTVAELADTEPPPKKRRKPKGGKR
jgi:hypothetical protein